MDPILSGIIVIGMLCFFIGVPIISIYYSTPKNDDIEPVPERTLIYNFMSIN